MTQTHIKFTILNIYQFFYKKNYYKNKTNTYFLIKNHKYLNNIPLTLINI